MQGIDRWAEEMHEKKRTQGKRRETVSDADADASHCGEIC
jgi:hypothetical protein